VAADVDTASIVVPVTVDETFATQSVATALVMPADGR
jgi:hypothetical protein